MAGGDEWSCSLHALSVSHCTEKGMGKCSLVSPCADEQPAGASLQSSVSVNLLHVFSLHQAPQNKFIN